MEMGKERATPSSYQLPTWQILPPVVLGGRMEDRSSFPLDCCRFELLSRRKETFVDCLVGGRTGRQAGPRVTQSNNWPLPRNKCVLRVQHLTVTTCSTAPFLLFTALNCQGHGSTVLVAAGARLAGELPFSSPLPASHDGSFLHQMHAPQYPRRPSSAARRRRRLVPYTSGAYLGSCSCLLPLPRTP